MKSSVIVWDLETVPDLFEFAAANDLVGKSEVEVREVIGEIWRRIGSSMGERCSSGYAGKVRPAISRSAQCWCRRARERRFGERQAFWNQVRGFPWHRLLTDGLGH